MDRRIREEDFGGIVTVLRNEEPPPLPGDFTEGVMRRVARLDQPATFACRLASPLPAIRGAVTEWKNSPRSISTRECTFYFLLSGVFYLVVGAIFMGCLRGGALSKAGWLRWQPEMMILTSLLFISSGLILSKGGKAGIMLVQMAILVSVASILVNWLFMGIALNIPRTLAIGFLMMHVVMGLLLFLAVHRAVRTGL